MDIASKLQSLQAAQAWSFLLRGLLSPRGIVYMVTVSENDPGGECMCKDMPLCMFLSELEMEIASDDELVRSNASLPAFAFAFCCLYQNFLPFMVGSTTKNNT
eukprot:437866-Pelagomonas_calceolata.AAC.4